MANNISPRLDYEAIQDAFYKATSLTSILDTPSEAVKFINAGTVLYRDTSAGPLHSKTASNRQNEVTVTWNSYKLDYDRVADIVIDSVEDDQAGGAVMADAITAQQQLAIGELDAYRFAKMAGGAGVTVLKEQEFTGDKAYAGALDKALQTVKKNRKNATVNNLYCFVSGDFYRGLMADMGHIVLNGEGVVNTGVTDYNGLKIIEVPGNVVFASAITLKDDGFEKTSDTGKDINYLIVDPASLIQVITHQFGNYFAPGVWQGAAGEEAYKYRVVGGTEVRKNMAGGIVVSVVDAGE